jgi:dihydroflavonol-4-reductase
MARGGEEGAMKAFVTGANGFIGSHLVEFLLSRGWNVRCLVRQGSDLRWIEHLHASLIYGDLRDKSSLQGGVEGRDVVFHLAAILRASDPRLYYEINHGGTRNLVEACVEVNPGLKRFVYVSSIAAAGPSGSSVPRNEDAPVRPANEYGKTKLLGEEAVREHGEEVPSVIVRPTNIYGPREWEFLAIARIVRKRVKPLLGNGKRQTTLCAVWDLVRALVMAATSDRAVGQTYYITDGCAYTYREIVDHIAALLDISGFTLPLHQPLLIAVLFLRNLIGSFKGGRSFLTVKRLRDLKNTYLLFDGSRAEHELGFVPEITLEEGLRRTIGWYRREGIL